ncbi:MAG: pyruvate ferredoxin oxidoreductase [candidate division WOR-3 bacterium]
MEKLKIEKKTKKVLYGNHAVSYGVKLSRVEVISAYPITPQTQVVELLSEMCGKKELNATFVNVESEHSAMAVCIGASITGARTFTATSSQGLLLMHELLHWAAGDRLPIVMAAINRAVGAPWSIWSDQNDTISQRDTGWMQIYCESNQEVLDSVILSYKVSEKVYLPTMIVLDAFILSHTAEPVEIPDQEEVDEFLPPLDLPWALSPENPFAIGAVVSPSGPYMEFRYKIQKAMETALYEIEKAGEEFEKKFGRRWGLVEEFMMDDAETVIVSSGAISSTVKYTVNKIRKNENKKIGVLRIRVLRPFPFNKVRELLEGRKKVIVLDRNISFGLGGVFFNEIRSSLYTSRKKPKLIGYIVGLGGRDITPSDVYGIIKDAEKRKTSEDIIFWGLKEENINL